MTQFKRLLSVILCLVLIAATALFTIGCSDKKDVDDKAEQSSQTGESADTPKEVGEGNTKFDFVVKDLEGNETKFVVKTDKKIVGEALVDAGLIEGEQGQYGLYVKKVNGITADFDKDQTYWAFYVNGEYAMTGVDMTEIEEGKVYSFVRSK